ncbi:MAG: HlyD family efflux transporter periplasmic adaptor subunit [Alicyclobacillus sp.]|nr:HlyD family efflux transporter periplasmic adaptor subunit [Alicyclobacillus sp.]
MSTVPELPSSIVPPLFQSPRRKWIYGGVAAAIVLGVGIPSLMHYIQRQSSQISSPIYQVRYGDITQTIGVSGTIEIPAQVNLSFQGSGGVLTSLPVKVGDKVRAGQVVARIDDSTQRIQLSQAESSVAQAEANLASAEANYQKMLEGTSSSQIAADRLAVQRAKAALQSAEQQYQDELAVYNDRTSAQQQLVSAQNALKQAEQQAADQTSNNQSVLSAQQALTTAQATVASDQLMLKSDEANLTAAQQALANAQAALKMDQEMLANDQAKYGNITAQQVQQAYQTYQNAEADYYGWQHGGFTGQNPYEAMMSESQTRYNELNSAYQSLQADQQNVTKDEQTISQEQAAVDSAQNKVAQDQQTISSAQSQVEADEEALANAKAQEMDASEQAQLQVQAAKQSLQLAKAEYNDRTAAKQSLDNALQQIQQDKLALDSAEQTLQQDLQPPDKATVAQAAAAVATAKASLRNAESQLESARIAEQETMLRSSVDGVVTAVNFTVGDVANGTILSIMPEAKDGTQVDLQVSDSQIGSVRPGEPIQLTADALPNDTFTGQITQIYPIPQTTSTVTEYTVLASVDNSLGKLRPGMSANVTIQVAHKTHVLVIPAISLAQIGTLEGVYVVGMPHSAGADVNQGGSGNVYSGPGNRSGGTGGNLNYAFSGNRGGLGGQGGLSANGGTGARANFSERGFVPAGVHLPKGVYFQPVQIGLFGSNEVEVTSGLTEGEKILLVAPGQSVASSQAGSGGRGFGGGFVVGRGFGGGFGGGGGGRRGG